MSLSNMMRKAADLLVEMPPESENFPASRAGASPLDDDDMPDLDLPASARLPASLAGAAAKSSSALQPKSIEQIVREAQGPNLDEVKVDGAQISAATGAILKGEGVDFAAIYRAANLQNPTFGAEQMLETLGSLPVELPLATRRATVRAMLSTLGKATGATPETVVADASRKLAALESFEKFMAKKTADATAQSEREIGELEKQIDARRQAIQKAKGELLQVTNSCEAESHRLDDVLEFFSMDVGDSKYAPPGAPGAAAPDANSKSIPAVPPTIQIPRP